MRKAIAAIVVLLFCAVIVKSVVGPSKTLVGAELTGSQMSINGLHLALGSTINRLQEDLIPQP